MAAARASRLLKIDYSEVSGAFERKRKLKLSPVDSTFRCPVDTCRHSGFASKRGLRKHLESRHPWYFYFNAEPDIRKELKTARNKTKSKYFSRQVPGFSMESGFGKSFLDWLVDECGGGKKTNDAKQEIQRLN